MTNQDVSSQNSALELTIGMTPESSIPFFPIDNSGAMTRRAAKYASMMRNGPPVLMPTELIASHVLTLPKAGSRQRAALLKYAVEDLVAVPIDTVGVMQAPLATSVPGEILALVVARDVLAGFEQNTSPVLPDFLLVPRPAKVSDTPAWAVWRDGARAIVRASDGTGFAAPADQMPMLWSQAGEPTLTSLGDTLTGNLPAVDLSDNPPPPDTIDMAFSFPRVQLDNENRLGILKFLSVALIAALAVHVGIAAFDLFSLRQLAEQERARAQAAIATPLPGISLEGSDVEAILARLAPTSATQTQGTFLPLLSDVATEIAQMATPVSFRRLAWSAEENSLVVLVQGSGLDDLQQLQQRLETAGFIVRTGAANASGGGAEVEMRISLAVAR